MSYQPKPGDIAIVGMSGLFAKASSAAELWSNILAKVDAISEPTDDWLGDDALFAQDSPRDEMRIYTKRGGFLNELARFDPRPFGTMPISVIGGEPDQFLALKCATEALADAGCSSGNFDNERTGIILGHAIHANRANVNGFQQALILTQTVGILRALFPDAAPDRLAEVEALLRSKLPKLNVDSMPGLVPNMMTGRIANRLDLMGPNYIMDAACASSLLAIDAAMSELRTGRADLMLAGGVNTTISSLVASVFCQIDALSRTSTVRPFDRAANGTLLGEGQGIVVLKRLEDAVRDGDRIYAVVRAVGASSDGRAMGLMAPRLEGEILAIRRAYEASGIDPASIGLIEAHGTGIPLGDRTEIDALRSVFGDGGGPAPRIALGSIKSMIGHCIPAAGVASVIKVSLALYHKVLPPTLVDEVNPDLGLERTPFYLNTEARPWVHGGPLPRRAGIDAFGFGGINSHMIIEETPGQHDAADPAAAFGFRSMRPHLVTLRAPDRESLLAQLARLATEVDGQAANAIEAISAASLRTDDPGPHRLAIVATGTADLRKKLLDAQSALSDTDVKQFRRRNGVFYSSASIDGGIAFLFPGENSQYPNMLRELAMALPMVREWLDALDALFAGERELAHSTLLYPPPTCLSEAQRDGIDQALLQVDYGSECVFYADMAIYSLLTALGVKADFMAGHSTGENAALVASGTASLDRVAAGKFVRQMNRVFQELADNQSIPSGSLLTIGATPRHRVDALLSRHPDLHFTMDNCPNQAIVFGPDERIASIAQELTEQGSICGRLPLSWAYHTPFVSPMADSFRELFRGVKVGRPHAALYSCATASPFPKSAEAVRRRACEQYVSRVRFTDLVRRLYDDGARIFIEVGPNNTLTSFVRDILGKEPHLALATDDPRRNGVEQLMYLLAQLFVAGLPLRLTALVGDNIGPQDQTPPEPVLKSALPFIKIDQDEAASIRALLDPDAGPRTGDAAVPVSVPATSQAPGQAPARPVTAARPPETFVAIRDHFALMQDFLQQQEIVATAALGPGQNGRDYAVSDISAWFAASGAAVIKRATWLNQVLTSGGLSRHAADLLSARESSHWSSTLSAGSPRRRAEWLLGRIAAKTAVADWLATRSAIPFAPSEIAILNDSSGRPHCSLSGLPDVGAGLHLSISHKADTAIAAVAERQIGVDIERIELEGRLDQAEGVAFDRDEFRLIRACGRGNEGFIYAWSAKEAAAKLRGQPLLGDQLSYRLVELDLERLCCRIACRNNLIEANFFRAGDYVYTLAHAANAA